MSAIEVKDLVKTYSFRVRDPKKGWAGNFFTPESKTVTAVNNISFTVQEGETVAFIGPNGAGKSTTIKMLTGILHPTSGSVSVLGLSPQRERIKLVKRIGAVFGQRSQLAFNLPLTDTFDLHAKVYEIPQELVKPQTERLIELFDLSSFLEQPVRKLSLGQRMRAEVAVSLLHNPEIIFLDEPSIGLDVLAKRSLRETLTKVNRELGTTIFLTSHDAGDIESVCKRTIVVNRGVVVFDGETNDLRRQHLNKKVVRIIHTGDTLTQQFSQSTVVLTNEPGLAVLEVNTESEPIASVLKTVLEGVDVEDISVEDPPLEEVIGEIYSSHALPR